MLKEIQAKVKAPKEQNNSFGNYKYRNAERILEHAKPILNELGCHLIMSDDIVEVGGRVYVKATVKLYHDGNCIGETHAFAREQEVKKGMDEAQITGACSSYARKYALCGLFAIDDSRDDPDSKDNRKEGDPEAQKKEEHDATWDEFLPEVTAIRTGLAKGTPEGFDEAVEAYYSIPDDAKHALALAPTKGGQWTTKEYAALKSNDFGAAKNRYYAKRNAA